jgi:drug/metabolite transporter (DMT)-like permease
MKKSRQLPTSVHYLFLIGIAAICLSCHAVMAKHLSASVTWPTLVLVRAFVTLLLLKLFFLREPITWTKNKGVWGRCIFGSLFVCFFYIALSQIPTPDVLAIVSTSPIWVAILYWINFKKKPTPAFWFAVSSMLIGAAILDQVIHTDNTWGITLAILAAISAATGTFSIEYCRELKSTFITFHLMTSLLLIGLIAGVIQGRFLSNLWDVDAESWLVLIAMSVFALGYQLLMVSAAKTGGAISATFAIVLGVLITSAFDMLISGFNLQQSIATFLVIVPCLFLFSGVISIPSRANTVE